MESEGESVTVPDADHLSLMSRCDLCGVVNRIKSGGTNEYTREFSAQHLRIDFVLKPPSCGSDSRIAPAQVPRTGREGSLRIQSKTAGRSPDVSWFPVSLMVVDSPPGRTRACGSASTRSDAILNSCRLISMLHSSAAL